MSPGLEDRAGAPPSEQGFGRGPRVPSERALQGFCSATSGSGPGRGKRGPPPPASSVPSGHGLQGDTSSRGCLWASQSSLGLALAPPQLAASSVMGSWQWSQRLLTFSASRSHGSLLWAPPGAAKSVRSPAPHQESCWQGCNPEWPCWLCPGRVSSCFHNPSWPLLSSEDS